MLSSSRDKARAQAAIEVAELDDDGADALYYNWQKWAFPKQLPPPGDWTTWLLMGGRGSGKTRAGAEWVRQLARDKVSPIALVGETMSEAIEIMVRGESGIFAVHPDHERPVLKGRNRLIWPSGAEAMILTASDPERFRGPQFAAAWCDELGCGAVDKGANQPNVFGDHKSAEGGRPYFSSGAPDGLIQRQVLRAHHRHWADPTHNPIGMVDVSRLYCWTWDARPFPAFPGQSAVWADGKNHATGHWLTGRLGGLASDELAAAVAGEHDCAIEAAPSAPLIGGLTVSGPGTARDVVEPILELTGQRLVAQEDHLVGVVHGLASATPLDPEALARADAPVLSRRRGNSAETPGRLTLGHFDRERDYLAAASTAMRPGSGPMVAETLPMVLDGGAARRAAERLLDRRAASGDRIEFALPPAQMALEPGDRVTISGIAEGPFEISEIRDGAVRWIAAGPVSRGDAVATSADLPRSSSVAPIAGAVPVALALHLPPLAADPLHSRMVVGAFADPWPGSIMVSDDMTGAVLASLSQPAVMGELTSDVQSGPVSRWDRGQSVEIRLWSGHLADVDALAALAGANRIALETDAGHWEVIGFARAELVAPGQYRLSQLLRGLDGSDTAMGTASAGRRVMVLDQRSVSLTVETGWIGESRTLRFAVPGGGDDLLLPTTLAAAPALPMPPVHLSARRQEDGTIALRWTRRSRADGDGWGLAEPPLEHVPEAWRVEIFDAGTSVRVLEATTAEASYGPAEQLADFGGPASAFTFAVRQLSPVLGAGHAANGAFDD